jgi:uncharacterized lipoprotein YajG
LELRSTVATSERKGKGAMVKLVLLTLVVLLACAVPSASTQNGPPCTSATSSVAYGELPTTIWYPPGCVHP